MSEGATQAPIARVYGQPLLEIPRDLYIGPRLNFEYNPNVAPTETVPAPSAL